MWGLTYKQFGKHSPLGSLHASSFQWFMRIAFCFFLKNHPIVNKKGESFE